MEAWEFFVCRLRLSKSTKSIPLLIKYKLLHNLIFTTTLHQFIKLLFSNKIRKKIKQKER
jgi:hypothetical protein